jgi:hypothetical protein
VSGVTHRIRRYPSILGGGAHDHELLRGNRPQCTVKRGRNLHACRAIRGKKRGAFSGLYRSPLIALKQQVFKETQMTTSGQAGNFYTKASLIGPKRSCRVRFCCQADFSHSRQRFVALDFHS